MSEPESDVESLPFETALQALEETVGRLEAAELSLEEALDLYERGQKLLQHCNRLLDAAVLRVEMLTDEGEIIVQTPG
ncbi:MAG: exodeoxyribonuclease VII small subunit [Candidatus Promineifilaceae bacterium]